MRGQKRESNPSFNAILNSIYTTQLKKINILDKSVNFRVPKPGIIIENDSIKMNAQFSNMEIRFTIDDSEPTINSTIYTSPIPVKNGTTVNAKAFLYGKESILSTYFIK